MKNESYLQNGRLHEVHQIIEIEIKIKENGIDYL